VELINGAQNLHYVSPLSHAENLLLYHFSGSRRVCNLYGRVCAAGSYGTVKATYREIGNQSPSFPVGDIIVVYDNNQVIGKQYRVSFAGNLPASTVTGITVIKNNVEQQVQRNTIFPNVLREGNKLKLLQLYLRFHDEISIIHRQYRYEYLSRRLEDVISDLFYDGKFQQDVITADKFENFHWNQNGLEYDRVPKTEGNCEIFDQACLMMNPNSEKTVTQVLDHIVSKSEQSDKKRNW